MNQKNEQTPPANNMEQLQQQASSCGAECNCHAAGNSGRGRWLVGGIVLLAAGALVVRAVMTDGPKPTPTKETAKTFVAPAVVTVPADAAAVAAPKAATATVVGRELAGFADLNALAAETTAVMVFLPAKAGEAVALPTAEMESAARTLGAKGTKVGLFTLKADSADYKNVTAQTAVPGVLVLVKGRGMIPVSGQITEAKLVQGFVAAASAGGCGPAAGGCGPAGCK